MTQRRPFGTSSRSWTTSTGTRSRSISTSTGRRRQRPDAGCWGVVQARLPCRMTRLPTLGPRGEGWVLIQAVLIVLVVAAAWSLGPDWTGPLRFLGIALGVALITGGLLFIVRGVLDLGGAFTPVPRPRDDGELVE